MTQLQALISSFQGKTVSIIGMGVSNSPLITLLLENKIPLTLRDKNPDPLTSEQFQRQGAVILSGESYLEQLQEDIIFRTPGLSPNTPQLLEAKKNGKIITSEMQEFMNLCPCPVIAVTGSDGKTTTTTLIAKFLEASGKKVFLGGNIGTPLLCQVDLMNAEDIAVVELSSFQLMDLHCDPLISLITNLSPNHLDYHHTMEEYITAKTNIFTHQSKQNTIIFNYDDKETMTFVPRIQSQISYFSRISDTPPEPLCNSTFLKDNTIFIHNNGESTPILPVEKLKVKGIHNVENFMASILAVKDFCTPQEICQVAESFYGVEHRMEFLRELHGISYYNDSIGTSPTRTIAGLHSFDQRIILLAGGYDKGIPFDQLGQEILSHVSYLILCGATGEKIKESVIKAQQNPCKVSSLEGEFQGVILCPNLEESLQQANSLAKKGDCVVLSPACAAFDQFKNFVQRGNHFKDLVQHLK